MIDLMEANFIRICRELGCPMCAARRQAEARYIDGILWEGVSDGYFRDKLKRSLGFCPAHAWALQAAEDSHWGGGLGTSLIYQDLTRRVLETLDGYVESQPSGWASGLKRWLTRLLQSFWPSRPATRLIRHLSPLQTCPACNIGDMSEKRFINTLSTHYRLDEVRVVFCQSDGLCLRHLRQALAQVDREVTMFLIEATAEKLHQLVTDLAEYERKHAWQFRDESKIEQQEHAWIRAVAFFAGEAIEAESKSVYQRRHRAQEIFHSPNRPDHLC